MSPKLAPRHGCLQASLSGQQGGEKGGGKKKIIQPAETLGSLGEGDFKALRCGGLGRGAGGEGSWIREHRWGPQFMNLKL